MTFIKYFLNKKKQDISAVSSNSYFKMPEDKNDRVWSSSHPTCMNNERDHSLRIAVDILNFTVEI